MPIFTNCNYGAQSTQVFSSVIFTLLHLSSLAYGRSCLERLYSITMLRLDWPFFNYAVEPERPCLSGFQRRGLGNAKCP